MLIYYHSCSGDGADLPPRERERGSSSQLKKVTLRNKCKQHCPSLTDRPGQLKQRKPLPQSWMKCKDLLALSKVEKSPRAGDLIQDSSCLTGFQVTVPDLKSQQGVKLEYRSSAFHSRGRFAWKDQKQLMQRSGYWFGHWISLSSTNYVARLSCNFFFLTARGLVKRT